MTCIAITEAAFKAIAAALPLGSVGYENGPNDRERKAGLAGPRTARPYLDTGPGA
jgi:hypothetical protein